MVTGRPLSAVPEPGREPVPYRAPHDPEAEAAFVGSLLLRPSALDEPAVTRVLPSDLYVRRLQGLYSAMLALRDAGLAIDGVTLRSHLGAEGPSDEVLRELESCAPLSTHVGSYAELISEHAGRRRLIGAAERIADSAHDLGLPFSDVQGIAHDALRWVDMPTAGGDESPDADAMALGSIEHEWIVPHLLEHQERVLVVAHEGHGKSLLLAQLAVQMAAGLHPWRMERTEPVRTLLVDLENPSRIISRRFAKLRAVAVQHVGEANWNPSYCRVESRPEGLDITQRKDQQWLMGRIAANRPDVVLLGPVYKLHELEEEKSGAVRQVQKVLDLVRARYRCALIMETHAPHESFTRDGKLRPAGSRLWIRWPEWVLALAPHAKDRLDGVWHLTEVRPGREQRKWPPKLRRGGAWPWEGQWL